ncbi:DUF669 domain-containing protein [Rubripirellula tenax]|nr:DUF669 domain-containing protein [Rubripirellula tenax]
MVKKLSEILREKNQATDVAKVWAATRHNDGRLPSGEYVAEIVQGEAFESSNATPGFRLTFEVVEGKHKGDRFWHSLWITDKAMPMTKRQLEKLNIAELKQLDDPLPVVFRCNVSLVLKVSDGGYESNEVKWFNVIGRTEPEPDPFAPKPGPSPSGDATPSDPDTIVAGTPKPGEKKVLSRSLKSFVGGVEIPAATGPTHMERLHAAAKKMGEGKAGK